MRIHVKLTLLMAGLTCMVALGIAAGLMWYERGRVREEASGRIQALLEGVVRIARESQNAKDELMLLSYLRFLMREHPEIEVAAVSRREMSSVMGAVRSELDYHTVTFGESGAPSFRAAQAPDGEGGAGRPQSGIDLPPGTVSIQLGFSKAALARRVRHAQLAVAGKIFSIAGLGVLAGALGAFALGRMIAGPVVALAGAARLLGEGRLDTRVEPRGKDEIAELARQFNLMAGRILGLARFQEDVVGIMSHDMRTPLAGVQGLLELLLSPPGGRPVSDPPSAYRTMLDSVTQVELSLANALSLFRREARAPGRREEVSVRQVLEEVVLMFSPAAQSNGISLAAPEPGRPAVVKGDRDLLRRVFVNLVNNAVNFTPRAGAVRLKLSEDAEKVSVSVADSGPGVAPEDRLRIFEKFYRPPESSGKRRRIPGSGLGLALAKRAVDAHGGKIWVEGGDGQGSVFHVTLPRDFSRARGPAGAAAGQALDGGGEHA